MQIGGFGLDDYNPFIGIVHDFAHKQPDFFIATQSPFSNFTPLQITVFFYKKICIEFLEACFDDNPVDVMMTQKLLMRLIQDLKFILTDSHYLYIISNLEEI